MLKVVQKTRLVVISTLASSIIAPALIAAQNPPVGIVVLGQHAFVAGMSLGGGTSLYDGDSVSTQSKGSLQIRIGASQIVLGENANLSLHRAEHSVTADLGAGTIRFSCAAGAPLEIHALGAVIRGRAGVSAGQIAIVGPNEFQVGSLSGALIVSVDGDTRTIAEGNAYDATLDSPADPQAPIPTARRRRILYFVIIPLIAFATIYPLLRLTLSPSAP